MRTTLTTLPNTSGFSGDRELLHDMGQGEALRDCHLYLDFSGVSYVSRLDRGPWSRSARGWRRWAAGSRC